MGVLRLLGNSGSGVEGARFKEAFIFGVSAFRFQVPHFDIRFWIRLARVQGSGTAARSSCWRLLSALRRRDVSKDLGDIQRRPYILTSHASRAP